jgi:hypothetical protein
LVWQKCIEFRVANKARYSCRSPARYSRKARRRLCLGRCTIGASLPIIGNGGCGVTGDSMRSFGSRLLR